MAGIALVSPTAPARRAFLGVERSVLGRAWRDRLDERDTARALVVVQRYGLPELLARIIVGRGVDVDEVDAFLDPALRRALPDPHVITAMEAAAQRIADAILRDEKVAIFGDYDVDGATAAAVLATFLRACGREAMIHIPDRIFEGYGPNSQAIRALAERGAKLLVTVDCGTTSFEPLAEATRLGLDVIVIDHHQADERLPPVTAVVNPNRLDDMSGLGYLAAVGLVFVTVVAVNRILRQRAFWTADREEPDLLALTDLVALGTVADVAPLKGLNRAFVAKGLIAMRRRERLGMTALVDSARLSGPPEPWHLGFMLGPRINAGGRIGRADLGARLLMTDDPVEAGEIAAELHRLNRDRQVIEQAVLAEAEAEAAVALGHDERGAVVVTAGHGWHPGVVGLIAARLKERFGRPAFAIALEPGGVATGSGRSIPGVDLGRAVRQAVADGILLKGGGHAMAAGVTLRTAALADFRARMEETLATAVEAARRERGLAIDGAVTAAAITPDFHAMIARAGPFGSGNPEPVLALPSHRIVYADEVGQAHVRLRLKSGDGATLDAIAFRAAGQPLGATLLANRGALIHAAGSIALDWFRGEARVQLRLLDVAPADPALAGV